jgi:hypothetical protein
MKEFFSKFFFGVCLPFVMHALLPSQSGAMTPGIAVSGTVTDEIGL